MKKIILGLILILAQPGIAVAAVVSIDAQTSDVLLNEVFSVDIVGSNFPVTEGGGVNLSFDASIVNVLSVDINTSLWDSFGIDPVIDNVNGAVLKILVNTINIFSPPEDNFIVATLELRAVGLGSTNLELSESGINPWSSSELLVASNFLSSEIRPGYLDGLVNVSAVPLPSALWLFASALLGIAGWRRKARSANLS